VLRNGLRRALMRDEFVLHYQPQDRPVQRAVIGAEALIRWNHPELGMVAPSRSPRGRKKAGLIVPIGEWVLREASRQAQAWRRAGPAGTDYRRQFVGRAVLKRGTLRKAVVQALESSGLDPRPAGTGAERVHPDPERESVLASVNASLNCWALKIFRIDDFGTGLFQPVGTSSASTSTASRSTVFVRDWQPHR